MLESVFHSKAQDLISSSRTDEMKMISLFFRPPVIVISKISSTISSVSLHPVYLRSHSYPFQYSYSENSLHRGAWWATEQEVSKESDRPKQQQKDATVYVAVILIDCLLVIKLTTDTYTYI